MSNFEFLQDEACRNAITELAGAAATQWAPDEVDLVDLVAEEYLDQVQAAGSLLYPTRSPDLALGIGEAELFLLVILPVVTGFMANLLATLGVRTMEGLHHKTAGHPPTDQPSTIDLSQQRVRQLVAPQAQVVGLRDDQVEQLVVMISSMVIAMLAANPPGGMQS